MEQAHQEGAPAAVPEAAPAPAAEGAVDEAVEVAAVDADEEEGEEPEYVVEAILQQKHSRGQMKYLVKWANYNDPADNTWEPEENLADVEVFQKYLEERAAFEAAQVKAAFGDDNEDENEDSGSGHEFVPGAGGRAKKRPRAAENRSKPVSAAQMEVLEKKLESRDAKALAAAIAALVAARPDVYSELDGIFDRE